MRGALLVARSELYRDLRSRGTWVLVLFVALVPVVRALAWRVAEAPARLARARAGDAPTPEELAGAGWAPLVESWRFGLVLGALALLIHGARGLAGDRDSGLARHAVTRSVSRPALVLGRALLVPLHVLGLVALTGLTAWLTVRSHYQLGDLVSDGYTLLTAEEQLAALRTSVLVTLPPLVALGCFALLAATVARTAVGAVALAVVAFLGYDLFKEVLGENAALVFATFVPSIFDASAMSEMVQVALGYSDAGMTDAGLRAAAILPWGWALGALLAAVALVARRRL